jgi:tetratricopeptide (TPR) repeat protein
MTLALLGKTELAIERAQQALRLSPFDSFNFRSNNCSGRSYFHTRRYADAEAAARSAIDANPSFIYTYAILTAVLMRLGRTEEAKAAAKTVLDVRAFLYRSWIVANCRTRTGRLRPLVGAWHEVGLPD